MSASASPLVADPIFDRAWWVYSLCRERLFADHTDTIVTALAPLLRGQTQSHPRVRLLEVGCGPGFYSRRLAARFPFVQATGVDTSERLLAHARLQAHRANLGNCSFLRADAGDLRTSLDLHAHQTDAAIASRLFLILSQRERVLSSIFEALRPGGIFFVAEPISALRTAIPLWLMRTLSRLDKFANHSTAYAGAPVRCRVLSPVQFHALLTGQPWGKVKIWQDKRYQYALCEKSS